jgi:hypothetical protein
MINPLKPSGTHTHTHTHTPHALTINKSAFCICGFLMFLRENSDDFLKLLYPVDF